MDKSTGNKNDFKNDENMAVTTEKFKLLVKAKNILLEHKQEYDFYLSLQTSLSFDAFLAKYKNSIKSSMHFADYEQPSLEKKDLEK